ncbi:hypothetical protein ACHAWU_007673 [Discostella pseudostelligera]|uniref:Uncharacterized protein n=1 Tax=Discostella pseudostelligera TaxID=259834 RepID=A0ABD3MBC7_9STRA
MDAQGFECSIVEGMGKDVAGIIDVLNNGEFSGLTDNTGAEAIAETTSGFDLFASKRVGSRQ